MLQKFWFRIIVWDPQKPFWNGKTYFTTQEVKYANRAIKIGNYRSDYFDFRFNTHDDLIKLLNAILVLQQKNNSKYVIPVIVVIDEAAIYFWNRDFKNFPRELSDFMVQLRKVQVYMPIITQSVNMIDKNFRRLTQDVIMYTPFFKIFTLEKQFVAHDPETWINFVDEKSTTKVWWQLRLSPWARNLLSLWHPDYDTKELLFARPNELNQELRICLQLNKPKYENQTISDLSHEMFRLWQERQPVKKEWKKIFTAKKKIWRINKTLILDEPTN